MSGLVPYRDIEAVQAQLAAAYDHHHVMAAGKVLFERLGQTPWNEQHRLLDSTALEATLAGNAWFEANYPGVMEPPFYAKELPSQEEVNALYGQLHEMVHEAVDRAEASGKTLLVLFGDSHYNRNSQMLEHMLLDIVKKAGVDTFINEIDARKEAIAQDNLLYWQKQGLTRPPNDPEIKPALTNDYFWDISPFEHYVLGDPVSTTLEEWNLSWGQKCAYRETYMIEAITGEVDGPAVGIFGANHFKGLIEGLKGHPEGERFEILPLNLSPTVLIPNRKAMEQGVYKVVRGQYNHENIPRLIVPGSEVSAATAWDMAAEAAAHFERKELGLPEEGHAAIAARPAPDMLTARGR